MTLAAFLAGVLRLFRYTLIGGVATTVHYAVLVTLVELFRLAPPPAAVSGAGCGALVAYVGNRRFTFASRARHRRSLPRFLSIAALGAILNGVLVWVGTSALSLHYLVAQALATLLVLWLTYELNRIWTFR